MKHIVLTGFMGAGKTTLGKALAKDINYNFIDLDHVIVQGEEKTIEMLIHQSECYFRKLELAYLKPLIYSETPSIIALGGGTFCEKEAELFLKNSNQKTVFLELSEQTLLKRLDLIKSSRPLLLAMKGDQWKLNALSLYKDRLPQYKKATSSLIADELTVQQLKEHIQSIYGTIF